MNPHNQEAYKALRAYLTHLLTSSRDRALEEVPVPLRASVEIFMQGRTVSHNEAARVMIYAHDLATWAFQVIHVSGLEYPVLLASVDIADLRQAMAV